MRPSLLVLACLAACRPDPDSGTPPVDTGRAGNGPTPAFDRFCPEAPWEATLEPTILGETGTAYQGAMAGLEAGSLETMKFMPEHPFRVEKVRLTFTGGSGTARVRLMTTFGRSYPGGWPDLDAEGVNLVPPVDLEIPAPDIHEPVEVDLSGAGVYLLPTEHYMVVNEYLQDGGPALAVEALRSDASSRALLLLPGEEMGYGLDGNFRVELEGSYFCAWDERWFQEDAAAPFADEPVPYVAVADLDGDGHEDVVLNANDPQVYRGDGAGGFTLVDPSPFAEVPGVSMLVFGDLDGDGDADAFAATYVGADNDGDGWTLAEGDCNDADTSVDPNETETTDGRDEDCDGIADDGTDTADADADGFSIADGDCDDTRADVYPGAPEAFDSRDQDCDLQVDEDFPNRVLLNDGTGHFTILEDAGVEVLDPTTAAAFADADLDGHLDLYWGNWLEHYPDDRAVPDRFFRGQGDGTFTDGQEAAGLVLDDALSCYGVEWADWNGDGAPDLFVGNYHLYDNQLWENQGDGTFVDVALAVGVAHDDEESPYRQYPGGHTYGGDFGDVDNDGDLDFYMANLAHPRVQPWSDPSMFVVNQGPPDHLMVNLREESGFIYDEGDVNAQFADFDHDGDLDLAVASLYTHHYSRLYRNDGAAGFTDVTYETGTAVEEAVSVVWVDVDEDGDLDLLVADRSRAPYVHLFLNRVGQDRPGVVLHLEGTTTNRDAVGARVTLTAGGVTQIREVPGGGGHHNTQRPRSVHFGLGEATAVDSVTVRWVGGATETITGVAPGGRYRVVEGTGQAQGF